MSEDVKDERSIFEEISSSEVVDVSLKLVNFTHFEPEEPAPVNKEKARVGF